jgi:hypothetical protein
MTKSEIFKAAHHFAKSLEGNYSARFSFALKIAYAVSKMNKEEGSIFLAQNIPGYSFDYAVQSVKNKLAKFNADVSADFISLKINTYEIKETLKSMGFKFNACGKSWTKYNLSINEVIEIANKLAA